MTNRQELAAHVERLRLLVDTDGIVVDEFRVRSDFLRNLITYIDLLEAEAKKTSEPATPPAPRGWNSVSVIGEVGHSYGVVRNELGVLVIASKRADKAEWAHGIKPKGDCWLTILGGNTRWSVTYEPLPDSPAGS